MLITVSHRLAERVLASVTASLPTKAQLRDSSTWTSVLVSLMDFLATLDDALFEQTVPRLYPGLVDLLVKDLAHPVRHGLRAVLVRVGARYVTVHARSGSDPAQ